MISLQWIIIMLFTVNVRSETIETNTKTTAFAENTKFALKEVTGLIDVMKSWANTFEKYRRRLKKAYNKFVTEAFSAENKVETYTFANVEDEDESVEESNMLSYQLIVYHGYKVESHTVQTKDGCLLKMFRIISRYEDSTKRNKTVLLLHGLMQSSDSWLLLGPKIALPYILLQAGCDVWLPNFRGNKYSNTHTSKLINKTEFWDFSFHEMGTNDLKSLIDYVIDIKGGSTNITLIGHAMGATAILVLLSTQQQYNHILNDAVLLAPLAFMHEIKGPLKAFANMYSAKRFESLAFFGYKQFIHSSLPKKIVQQFCKGDNISCWNPILLISNGGKTIQNQNLLKNIMGHTPDATSARTIYHYIQLINSGRFQNIDHGEKLNIKTYGMKVPPDYQLHNVTLPIYVFSSYDDWLATIPNVLNLVIALKNVVSNNIIQNKVFTHTDFVWGEHAPNSLFKRITEIVRGKYNDTAKEINYI